MHSLSRKIIQHSIWWSGKASPKDDMWTKTWRKQCGKPCWYLYEESSWLLRLNIWRSQVQGPGGGSLSDLCKEQQRIRMGWEQRMPECWWGIQIGGGLWFSLWFPWTSLEGFVQMKETCCDLSIKRTALAIVLKVDWSREYCLRLLQ